LEPHPAAFSTRCGGERLEPAVVRHRPPFHGAVRSTPFALVG